MATAETRRVLDRRRRADRDRKRKQRAAELSSRTPDQRAIDRALALAVQRTIAAYGGLKRLPKGGGIDRVVDAARTALRDGGYDIETERARVLFRRTLAI